MKSSYRLLGTLALLTSAGQAFALDYTVLPDVGSSPSALPGTVLQVSGKEYADEVNRNANGTNQPMQTIRWDGLGGVTNGYGLAGVGMAGYVYSLPSGVSEGQLDAMANRQDELFSAFVQNRTAGLYSLRNNANWGAGADVGAPIYYEATHPEHGVWATAQQINQDAGVQNLIGLEVWGSNATPDANVYSLLGDAGGFSLYRANGTGLVSHDQIVAAVQSVLGWDNSQMELIKSSIDLDAALVSEATQQIVFSIWNIDSTAQTGKLYGDMAIVLNYGTGDAAFLNHGGHVWDNGWTASIYGGTAYNVDALETAGVPEPSALALLGLGLFASIGARRRMTRS